MIANIEFVSEDGTNDNITAHTNLSTEPKQDEVNAKIMATVSENNTNLTSEYINVGKVTFMQTLGLSLRSKYFGFTNKEYTSKFLRSQLICVDIPRSYSSAPEKISCNIDVIENRSDLEVDGNTELDVHDNESSANSKGIVNSEVHVVDEQTSKSDGNDSKCENLEEFKVPEKNKVSKRFFSHAMKMLTQYGESLTEQSDNIDE